MNIVELYEQTPVERHAEIIVSGDRLFFESEEFIIGAEGELRLIKSQKELEQRLAQIDGKLPI